MFRLVTTFVMIGFKGKKANNSRKLTVCIRNMRGHLAGVGKTSHGELVWVQAFGITSQLTNNEALEEQCESFLNCY